MVEAYLIALTGLIVSMFGSVMGAGGGFLLVPALVALTGLTPPKIAGTSLLFVLCGKSASWIGYHRLGVVDYRVGRLFMLPLIAGVVFGYTLNSHLTVRQFSISLAAVMALMGLLIFKHSRLHIPHLPGHNINVHGHVRDRDGHDFDYDLGMRRSVLMGFVTGTCVPLFGIGGSVLLVPLLITGFGMPEKVAAGTGQFVTLSAAAPGALLYVWGAHIDPAVAAPLCVAALVGATIGTRTGYGMCQRTLRLMMSGLLFIAAMMLGISALV